MATEYRYPDENSPTASWLPSRCPMIDGSDQEDDDGVATALAAGGRQVADQIADPTYFIRHRFAIPWSEVVSVTGWRAFRDAILGREFRVTDDFLGAFVSVRLWEYSRRWQPIGKRNGVQFVTGSIVMRRVVS